jgi:glycerophosphoryl diester phosphodiesterase
MTTYVFWKRVWMLFPIVVLFLLFSEKLLPGEEHSTMTVLTRTNVAHRGASFLAPENTLIAYRIAISAGADGAECDVYSSSDGVVFLSHDKTAKRTLGGGDQNLSQMTYAEIQKLDAGLWKGKQFRGEKVPKLDDYLELLKGTNCHPVIEIKMDGIEQLVLETVRKHDMTKVTTIITWYENIVKEVRRLEPNICVAWLAWSYGEENLKGTPEENAECLTELLIKKCKELDITVLDLGYDILSADLIKNLQNAGIHVWCFTVNDVNRMNKLLDWGVESITTDRPELLNEVLKTRKTAKK